MGRVWIAVTTALLALATLSTPARSGQALAWGHAQSLAAKKTCKYVTKKVHGKKKRVKVCSKAPSNPPATATPTLEPSPTATPTAAPQTTFFDNPWPGSQQEKDHNVAVVVMNVEGQPAAPSLEHIESLYQSGDPTTGESSVEAFARDQGLKDVTFTFSSFTLPKDDAPGNVGSPEFVAAEDAYATTQDPALKAHRHVVYINPYHSDSTYTGGITYENPSSRELSIINGQGTGRTEVSLHKHEVIGHQFGGVHVFDRAAMDPVNVQSGTSGNIIYKPGIKVYDDASIMGDGTGDNDAVNKLIQGDFTTDMVALPSASTDIQLFNREGDAPDIRLIRIPRIVGDGIHQDTSNSAIYVEYQSRQKEDSNQSADEVHICIWDEIVRSNRADEIFHVATLPLDGSQAWTDAAPGGTGVTVSVVPNSASPDSVTTRISFPHS